MMVADVLPKPKVSVPEVISKSPSPSSKPPMAVPLTVAKSTRTPPPMPPVRCTVSVTLRRGALAHAVLVRNELDHAGEIDIGDRDQGARLALDELGDRTMVSLSLN